MALAAYRHLLHSARIAFQGDARLLAAARQQARQGFEANRDLPAASPEVTAGISHAEDVARILRHNIVQGQQQGKGEENYSETLGNATEPRGSPDMRITELRIHQDIERGDNESIKLGSPDEASLGQSCLSR
ncbi:MAG: Mitochondrial zinc maintenance protein 1, mitochondrial [Piccolia ochrophora]|nr:MAG: Mitochondrial zinc maintenance protein 1, mitochondrial [Piccolia ochrophora]